MSDVDNFFAFIFVGDSNVGFNASSFLHDMFIDSQ